LDDDNQLTVPFPSKINALIKAHGDRIMGARQQQQEALLREGRKVSVDEYASDHWLAQVLNLDLDTFTWHQKPRHLMDSSKTFDEIRTNVTRRKAAAKAREKYRSDSAMTDGRSGSAAGTQDELNKGRSASTDIGNNERGTGKVVTYPQWLRVRPLAERDPPFQMKQREPGKKDGEKDELALTKARRGLSCSVELGPAATPDIESRSAKLQSRSG
jgi:hypothetical protein